VLDEIEEFVTGVRPQHEPDRVLATVLFSDLVESTARAAAVGDHKWRDLLDAHDEAIRKQLDRHRGRFVKSTGDGVLATFDGPARAIRCASEMRAAVEDLGLEIRTGLHTGEIEIRGDDVGGFAVNLASRVCTEAAAGEVLVSRTVVDLVVGSGIAFEDRGVHPLKGVPGDWQLYAVGS
jgi:class 3 adenylate cyclase